MRGSTIPAGLRLRLASLRSSEVEEAAIRPSLLVGLAGCNLRCAFCNAQGGPAETGERTVSWQELQAHARARGVRTIQLTGGEPLLQAEQLAGMLTKPSLVPVVINTNLTLPLAGLEPLLPNLEAVIGSVKFGNGVCARRLAGTSRYLEPVRRQATILRRRLGRRFIVRHLLMPGHLHCCWEPTARWLAEELPHGPVTLLTGYQPPPACQAAPELLRSLTAAECEEAVALAAHYELALEMPACSPLPAPHERSVGGEGLGTGETAELVIDPSGRISVSGLGREVGRLVESLVQSGG